MSPVDRSIPTSEETEQLVVQGLYSIYGSSLKMHSTLYGDECKETIFHRQLAGSRWDEGIPPVDLKEFFSGKAKIEDVLPQFPQKELSYRGKMIRATHISYDDLTERLFPFVHRCDLERYKRSEEQPVWRAQFRCILGEKNDFAVLLELGEGDPPQNSQPRVEDTTYLVDLLSSEALLKISLMRLDCTFSLIKSRRFCRVSVEEPPALQADYLQYNKKNFSEYTAAHYTTLLIKQIIAWMGWGAFSSQEFELSPEEQARSQAIEKITKLQAPISPYIVKNLGIIRSRSFALWSRLYGEIPGHAAASKKAFLESLRVEEIEKSVEVTPRKYDFYDFHNRLLLFLIHAGAKRLEIAEPAPTWKAELRCSATEPKNFFVVLQVGEGTPAEETKSILKENFVFNRALTPAVFEKLKGFMEIKISPIRLGLKTRRFCRVFIEGPAEKAKEYQLAYELAAYIEKEVDMLGCWPEGSPFSFLKESKLEEAPAVQQQKPPPVRLPPTQPRRAREDEDDCAIL